MNYKIFGALASVAVFAAINTTQAAPILFGNCGATGATGPTQAACDTAYGSGLVTVAGGIQSWTVSTAGTYRIVATGAAGVSAQAGRTGGRGAQVSADFVFSSGDVLQLAVAQMGIANNTNGGGGGGSFVVDQFNTPLLVAGGGGGTRVAASVNGFDASTAQFGTTGSGNNGNGLGGGVLKVIDLGLGGNAASSSWGSGGAGFNGDGANDGSFGTGGSSWINGLIGGIELSCTGLASDGGFGGGGAGAGCGGGGGGGGYSGGDGGFIAGGGGSFLAGINQLAVAGIGTGHGSISIELLDAVAVPEPGTLILFGFGLVGLGVLRRKRAA